MKKGVWIKIANIFIERLPIIVFILIASCIMILLLNENVLKLEFIKKISQSIIENVKLTIFNDNTRDMHINLITIIMGFVITIISVFGTGYSNATIKICEENLENKFSFKAKRIMCITMFLLFVLIFFYYEFIKNEMIMLTILGIEIFSIIDFFVFGIITCKMFEYNIETAQDEFSNQNKRDEEIIYLLRNIANIDEPNIGNYEQSKKNSEELRKIQ